MMKLDFQDQYKATSIIFTALIQYFDKSLPTVNRVIDSNTVLCSLLEFCDMCNIRRANHDANRE
jgi:hypothetical protein